MAPSEEAAAQEHRPVESLAMNHPFVDGNKRVARFFAVALPTPSFA